MVIDLVILTQDTITHPSSNHNPMWLNFSDLMGTGVSYILMCIYSGNFECRNYATLNDTTRSISYGNGTEPGSQTDGKRRCDNRGYNHPTIDVSPDWKGTGWWYRFTLPAGTRIPESSPGDNHCGTSATGWLSGTHPTSTGESLDVKFCFHSSNGDDCKFYQPGKITNCGEFFVYYLKDTSYCALRYCATV